MHDIKYSLIPNTSFPHKIYIHGPLRSANHTEQTYKGIHEQEEGCDADDHDSEVGLNDDAVSPADGFHVGEEGCHEEVGEGEDDQDVCAAESEGSHEDDVDYH